MGNLDKIKEKMSDKEWRKLILIALSIDGFKRDKRFLLRIFFDLKQGFLFC